MFMTQRAPIEFAADRSPTGLAAYLDEIGEVLKRNAGILKLAESMQVIYRPGRTGRLRQTHRRGALLDRSYPVGTHNRRIMPGRGARFRGSIP